MGKKKRYLYLSSGETRLVLQSLIFKHEPKGQAAAAYGGLVKEVLAIGEKQRGRSAQCR